VSEKKFTKIIKRAFNNAIKMSSDEDLKLISGFEIDTVGVNN
jgi:F0F1-type ATP synthase delta subunit